MFDIVRLLQKNEDLDIFDSAKDLDGCCAFSGPKEVLKRLINLSLARGYEHTAHDFVLLAIGVARSLNHNAFELVHLVLSHIPRIPILQFKDRYDNTILHQIASQLGGFFGLQQSIDEGCRILVWDEGFNFEEGSPNRYSLPRQQWSSLLQSLNIDQTDIHPISKKRTPMTLAFDLLISNWHCSKSRLIDALSQFLRLWLSNLASLGICLQQYGKEERRLQDEGLVRKDFHRIVWNLPISNIHLDDSFGTLRLIGLTSSVSADEWKLWWSEPTDEFAGDFWRCCERKPTRIPGAWDEDFG